MTACDPDINAMLAAHPAVIEQVKRDALNRLRLGHPLRIALRLDDPFTSAKLQSIMLPVWRDHCRAFARRLKGVAA